MNKGTIIVEFDGGYPQLVLVTIERVDSLVVCVLNNRGAIEIKDAIDWEWKTLKHLPLMSIDI